jgi:hypothetical protein
MHFGQFLVDRDAVTPEQVLDALDEQRKASSFVGRVAVEGGFMTVSQVLEVLERQALLGPGNRFGELAVELGHIDAHECRLILTTQQETHLPLGEVLVRRGSISRKKMIELLADFVELRRPGTVAPPRPIR